MTKEELNQLYNLNHDFKRYVDECRKYDGRTIEEELELKSVKYKALDIVSRLKRSDIKYD